MQQKLRNTPVGICLLTKKDIILRSHFSYNLKNISKILIHKEFLNILQYRFLSAISKPEWIAKTFQQACEQLKNSSIISSFYVTPNLEACINLAAKNGVCFGKWSSHITRLGRILLLKSPLSGITLYKGLLIIHIYKDCWFLYKSRKTHCYYP